MLIAVETETSERPLLTSARFPMEMFRRWQLAAAMYVMQMYVTENVGHMALMSDNQNEPKRPSHDRRM